MELTRVCIVFSGVKALYDIRRGERIYEDELAAATLIMAEPRFRKGRNKLLISTSGARFMERPARWIPAVRKADLSNLLTEHPGAGCRPRLERCVGSSIVNIIR